MSFVENQYFYQESDLQATIEIVLTGETERDVTVLVRGGMFDTLLHGVMFSTPNIHLTCVFPTGPSDQAEIGPNKVVFSEEVVFRASGAKQQIVSTLIVNDMIALEADEIVSVNLTIVSPSSGVKFGNFSNTVVTIVDDDRKLFAFKPCCLIHQRVTILYFCRSVSLACRITC